MNRKLDYRDRAKEGIKSDHPRAYLDWFGLEADQLQKNLTPPADLVEFYQEDNYPDLVAVMQTQIASLQETLESTRVKYVRPVGSNGGRQG